MQIWDNFLKLQELELGKEAVEKWLKTLKVLNFDACNIYLEASDSFHAHWFKEHILPKAKLINNNHHPIKIHLSVEDKKNLTEEKTKDSSTEKTDQKITVDSIDDDATYPNFISSEKNGICFKLLSEIAGFNIQISTFESPKIELGSFNPIYLYGPTSVGKSHLLYATYHALKARNLNVQYVRCDTFTHNMVSAMRQNFMPTFRKQYRKADVLLIDDVHLLSGKNATQEEFFHTFNTLHLDGKQIILTSNLPPQELTGIEPRLISRFEWGIVLPLKTPSESDLKKILDHVLFVKKFPIRRDVYQFIFQNFSTSTKSLLKAIQALILRIQLKHPNEDNFSKTIDLSYAKRLMEDLLLEQKKEEVTPQKVVASTAYFYGIRDADILGKSQSRECAHPRQIAMYFCREKLSWPYTKIGKFFQRDHSTVITSVKQIQKNVLNQSPETLQAIRDISKALSL